MTKSKYDIVVVGAGPAGTSAARRAAEMGNEVLLVEKKREVGVPIQCGEFLPTLKEMIHLVPNAKRVQHLLKIPKRVIDNYTTHVSIFSPSGKSYTFKFDAYVLDRSRFDKWLTMEAVRSGGELQIGSEVFKVKRNDNRIFVRKGRNTLAVEADVIIVADGPYSRLTRLLGLDVKKSPYNYSFAIQFLMSNVEIDPRVVEMYFGKEYAPGGYAWIIPKGDDVANVGLGIRTPFYKTGISLRNYLRRFIEKHPVASKKLAKGKAISITGGIIPVGGPIPRTFTDKALIVGDAAGQVMASNGGGIPLAVICGDIAGEVANYKLHGEHDLSLYEKTWKKEVGKELHTSVEIRKLVDLVMQKDMFVEKAFELLGEDRIRDVVCCKLPLPLSFARKLVKKLLGN